MTYRNRVLVSWLVVTMAACGALVPPEFGRLTGDWDGWCCPDRIDFGSSWSVSLVEDSSGEVTGTVTRSEVHSVYTPAIVSEGTVTGDHTGSEVVLYFRYEGGLRGVFRGKQISETTLQGSMSGFRDSVIEFERSLGDHE